MKEASEGSNKNWNIHITSQSISNKLYGQKIRFILEQETVSHKKKKDNNKDDSSTVYLSTRNGFSYFCIARDFSMLETLYLSLF